MFEYQLQQFAFYDGITMDIIVRVFINLEKETMNQAQIFKNTQDEEVKDRTKRNFHSLILQVKMMVRIIHHFTVTRYVHLEVEP